MSSFDAARSHDWTEAFNKLNQLSPVMLSPANGPSSDAERSENALSFPVSGNELEAQLDAWANVNFSFGSEDLAASALNNPQGATADMARLLAGPGEQFDMYSNLLANANKEAPKGKKPRKAASAAPTPGKEDELNRMAIEEDRRRRNTLASARFRIKKKQREQALESTTKELRDRVAALEKELGGLRTENKWLRSLIVEKAESTTS